MAVYKLFPSQDATMYSLFPQMNTGLDEIIEISNLNFALSSFPQVSRYLVQFDQDEIDNVIDGKIKGVQWDAHLRNYIATAQGINLDTRLYIYPVSGAWGMGTGKYLDSPIVTNGVSWQYQVQSGSAQWATSGFGPYVTASYSGSNAGGGTWYTGSNLPGLDVVQTQTFSYRSDKDLNVIVTDTVKAWYTSSKNLFPTGTGVNGVYGNSNYGESVYGNSYIGIVNNGFLVKWEGYNSYEDATGNYYVEFNQNKNTQPVLQYYSVDTHTIYPPQLEFRWRDYVWNTGSSTQTVIGTSQVYASIINNGGFFYSQSIQQFRVDCRPQFPPIVFQTASIYTTNYYLPTASYWAIKDLDTNEYVVDFDSNYTQISADSTSSYFTVYMNGLQPERYYTILLQTTIAGTTLVLDSNYNFKVING